MSQSPLDILLLRQRAHLVPQVLVVRALAVFLLLLPLLLYLCGCRSLFPVRSAMSGEGIPGTLASSDPPPAQSQTSALSLSTQSPSQSPPHSPSPPALSDEAAEGAAGPVGPASPVGAAGPAGAADEAGAGACSYAPGTPPVWVHVTGAVEKPGVYRLVEGARAIEALQLAGGESPDAALHAVNLAAPLQDGQQLYIPTLAEVEALAGTTAGQGAFGFPAYLGPQPSSSAVRGVDINNATITQLQLLPGIGPVLAERIVAFRLANGPFRSVDELTQVSGIGAARLADIRPLVIIR